MDERRILRNLFVVVAIIRADSLLACAAEKKTASVFPVTVLICRDTLSQVSVDADGVVALGRLTTQWQEEYAKVTREESERLQDLVGSKSFARAAKSGAKCARAMVCGSPKVQVGSGGWLREFSLTDSRQLPIPIAELLGEIDAIRLAHFGSMGSVEFRPE
jgi:hypothetical protein